MKQEDRAHCVPCPTCKQYSHSIGNDAVAAAFNHFQTMIAHPLRGTPMGYAFDETTRDAAQVLMTLATPTLVIETEGSGEAGLRDALVSYALQYGPRCRDCADEDGVCPNNGMGCGDRRKATEYVVGALMYGARHGFCPAALAAERSTDREAVAEIERLIAGIDQFAAVLAKYNYPAGAGGLSILADNARDTLTRLALITPTAGAEA